LRYLWTDLNSMRYRAMSVIQPRTPRWQKNWSWRIPPVEWVSLSGPRPSEVATKKKLYTARTEFLSGEQL